MKRKIVLLLLAMTISVNGLWIFSCQTDSEKDAGLISEPESGDGTEDDAAVSKLTVDEIVSQQSLTIYTMSEGYRHWTWMNNISESFLSHTPGFSKANIKIREIAGDVNEYVQIVTADLMAGDGPDVLFFHDDGVDNANKFLQQNIFCDLNKVNENTNILDWSKYNQVILKCGEFRDERKFIPITYSIPYLFTTKEILEKYSIPYGDGVTLGEFASSLYDRDGIIFSPKFSFGKFYELSGLNEVSMEIGKVGFRRETMTDLLDIYQNLYIDIYHNYSDYSFHPANYDGGLTQVLLDEKALFLNSGDLYSTFATIEYYLSVIDELVKIGQHPIFLPFPDYTGSGEYTASAGLCTAITRQSNNKELGLYFISHMLDTMTCYNNYIAGMGVPITNEYNDIIRAKLYGKEANAPADFIFRTPDYSKEFRECLDSYYNIIDNITKCIYPEEQVRQLIHKIWYNTNKEDTTITQSIEWAEKNISEYLLN